MGLRTQQLRTIVHMNMHLVSGDDCEHNMWPRLRPSNADPRGLRTFMVADSHEHPDDFCHFFIDDYRFERLWNQPEAYLDILRRYAGVIAPDFSTYTDMPYPMQLWNVYRSRALAYYWQSEGIEVIPNIMFSDETSYQWMFDGLPHDSVLAASSVGVYKNPEWRKEFVKGMEHACNVLKPRKLVLYGTKIEFDTCGAVVKWYKNDNAARVRRNCERIREDRNGKDNV